MNGHGLPEAVRQEISLHMARWERQAMEVLPAVERGLSTGQTKTVISGSLVAQDTIPPETLKILTIFGSSTPPLESGRG